ncbi:MAG: PAS domain S-box protein [Deltaproteobacteria bacterium]
MSKAHMADQNLRDLVDSPEQALLTLRELQVRQVELEMQNDELRHTQAENEARLRTLVRTIPDLVWLKDLDGIYLACNRMFERFFGAKEEEIVGKTDYDFVDSELADFFREHDHIAMVAGEPTSNEEWITYSDNGQRVLLETVKTPPMYDSEGKLIGVLFSVPSQ